MSIGYGYASGQSDPQLKIVAGYAINLAIERLRVSGVSSSALESNICQAVAAGVGKETGVGGSIYTQYIQNNTGIDSLVGLGSGGAFAVIENAIGSALFSSYSQSVKSIYSIVTTAALIGGYVADVEALRLNGFLSGVYLHLSNYLGSGPSGNVFVPNSVLATYQSAYSYSGVLADIYEDSPKNSETNKIYFKYYNLETSFSDAVDINLAKDSAIQEYRVSGEFVYSIPYWQPIADCVEVELPLYAFANNSARNSNVYVGPSSFPCIDQYTKYQPPSGIRFQRDTIDGPYSTGNWTKSIISDYHSQDQSHLTKNQYRSNRFDLVAFNGSIIESPFFKVVSVDLPIGEYVPAFAREYNDAPTDNQKIHFHVGNASGARRANIITGYKRQQEINPLYASNEMVEIYETTGTGLLTTTGIRFIPLTLNPSAGMLGGTITNPSLSGQRIYDLALNLNTGAYIDFTRSNYRIAGPPQISEIADMPYIAFYQDFYSRVNGTTPKISLSFAVSLSEVEHSVSPGIPTTFLHVLTGVGGFTGTYDGLSSYEADSSTQPDIDFVMKLSNRDLSALNNSGNYIKSFVLGMGNGISGGGFTGYSITNCGVPHSGYNFNIAGISTGSESVMKNFSIISGYSGLSPVKTSKTFVRTSDYGSVNLNNSLLGNSRLYDDVLEGWIHPQYGRVSVTKMYSYIKSGSNITGEFLYSGFDSGNTILDSVTFPLLPITPFASGGPYTQLIASGWTPIISKQRNGNFFPRYFNGPFATARKKFLYSHSHAMVTGHSGFKQITGAVASKNNSGLISFYNSTGTTLPISQYSGVGSGLTGSAGFPHLVIFDLEVKEYAVKEYYRKTVWNASQNPTVEAIPGVDSTLTNISWSEVTGFTKTNDVDQNYATPILYSADIFHMGYTGVNPLVYNSPPNYIHGFINDAVGFLSGTNRTEASSETWPYQLMPDPAAYLVQWKQTLDGSTYGNTIVQNPEGNFTFYKTYTRRVTGYYTPPGYRLADNRYHPEYAHRIFPTMVDFEKDVNHTYGYPGSDPIYFKRISNIVGISGVDITESIHGGVHPNGIFGDSWVNLSYSGVSVDIDDNAYTPSVDYGYGYGNRIDTVSGMPTFVPYRIPQRDNLIILTDINSTGIGIHFSALSIFPGGPRHGTGEFAHSTGFFRSGATSEYGNGLFNIEEQTFPFYGEIKTGYAYPAPGGNGWSGTVSGANTVYPSVGQWQIEHTGTMYHWRRASKAEFTFRNVVWSGHGQIPYDVEYMVIPSGDCSIQGKFKYNKLRESPVFSEGIFLSDVTPGDTTLTRGAYPVFISDTLVDHGETVTIAGNSVLTKAPSRQLELINPTGRFIKGDYDFKMVNTLERDFNKYIVIANSDYSFLNSSVLPSYEGSPPKDDKVFSSTMLYSANKGQQFPDGSVNPYIMKQYEVQKQYQYYDASLTDATGDLRFRTNVFPTWGYTEPDNARFVPANVTIREADKGFY